MKMYRTLLAILAVSAMVVSLGACSPAPTAPPSAPPTTEAGVESTPTPVPKDAETGLTPMEDTTPITFRAFLRDPEQSPAKDNPVLNKITELTGVTMEFEFLVGDLDQKIGVMTAGGDYPDVVFAGDSNVTFVEAGAFISLEDKLPNYANLNDLYSKHYELMTDKDGHIYVMCIFGAYGEQNTSPPQFNNGGNGFFMQKAVIEECGYKVPKTLDEYFGMIEEYLAKNPTIDGVPTVGFFVTCDGWRHFGLVNAPQNLMGGSNDGNAFVDLSTYTALCYQITDTAKSFYKKLNEEFHKGVIKADCFTATYDQFISQASSGAVLGMQDQAWNFGSATNALNTDKKYNRTYVSVPIANPGVKDSYLDEPTYQSTNGVGITVKCKDPGRLLSFYDWLLQRDVQDYLNWGIEGTDFVLVDGGPGKILTEERRDINNDTAKRRDLTGWALSNYSPKMQGLYLDGAPCTPGASSDEFKAGLKEYDQNWLKALNIDYFTEILSPPVQRPAYYPVWDMNIAGTQAETVQTAFLAVMDKELPSVIMAKDDATFETLWNKYVADFNATNPQVYLDEINKIIKQRMGN